MQRVSVLVAFVFTAAAVSGCPNGCTPPTLTGTGLQVIDPNVRACDAVFQTGGDEVPAVDFAQVVNGEAVPAAPRFAISFVAAADASLVGQELASFRFTREGNPPPTLVEGRCFDASGAPVAGSALTLTE